MSTVFEPQAPAAGGLIVGQSLPRVDALEKALGSARYTTDLSLPRMVVGRVLGSTYPNARVLRIETQRAALVPGVLAVVTAHDFPPVLIGQTIKDTPIMAREQVRFVEEPVAAVAALDEAAAEEALELIEVEYEELPAVFDPIAAMAGGAPLVHPDMGTYRAASDLHYWGNVCSHIGVYQGDVEVGFAESDHLFEDTFSTQMTHQAYLEPTAVLADYDLAGGLTLWSSTKSVYGTQNKLAEFLGLPERTIRVLAPRVGGSFGSKSDLTIETIAAGLAMKCGRPVKMVMTRHQEFTFSRPRHPAVVTVKTGVKRDGRLVAREMSLVYDTGAYAGNGPGVTARGTTWACGPYKIPHLKLDGYSVYTNKVPGGAFRGFGTPQAVFASESQIDMIARRLGIDPLELRLLNAVDETWTNPMGEPVPSSALAECLKQVAERIDWKNPPRGPNRALGICSIAKASGSQASSAEVRLLTDGGLALEIAAVDYGQGSDTVLCQMAAEVLRVPLERVRIGQPDTLSSPYNWGTASSRTTSVAGRAVVRAASDAKEQILKVAASRLEVSADDLELGDARVHVKGLPERGLSFQELGRFTHYGQGGPIIGRGAYMVESHPFQSHEGGGDTQRRIEGNAGGEHEHISFGALAADVEVDPETGQVQVHRLVAAHDVGKAINPVLVEGQIEGAVLQGVGYALSEAIQFEDGVVRGTLLNDYLVPLSMTSPPVEPIIVEGFDPSGPFGAKGVGEHALLGAPPAIASALEAAVGVRIKELPLSPERVLAALESRQGEQL